MWSFFTRTIFSFFSRPLTRACTPFYDVSFSPPLPPPPNNNNSSVRYLNIIIIFIIVSVWRFFTIFFFYTTWRTRVEHGSDGRDKCAVATTRTRNPGTSPWRRIDFPVFPVCGFSKRRCVRWNDIENGRVDGENVFGTFPRRKRRVVKGKKTNVENDLLFSTTKHSALAINLGHLSQNMRVWFSKYAFSDGKANRFKDFLFFSKLLYIEYSISIN